MKVVFQEVKALLNDKIQVTLDSENIPKEYVALPIDLSYIMTYNELYVVQGSKPSKPGHEDLDDDQSALDDLDKDCTVESVFKINKETLETEYNLITLNLEKIKVINLKEVLAREEKVIKQSDLQYLNDGRLFSSEKSDEFLKKRESSPLTSADLKQILKDSEYQSLKKLKHQSGDFPEPNQTTLTVQLENQGDDPEKVSSSSISSEMVEEPGSSKIVPPASQKKDVADLVIEKSVSSISK